MSLYFLVNNLVFTSGMIGGIVSAMAAWLSFDAYRIRPDTAVLSRAIGFVLVAFWQIIHAVNFSNDIVNYICFMLFVVGLGFIASSFLRKSELVSNAIIVIPSFTLIGAYLYSVSTILIGSIVYLSWRQWKREQNVTWLLFSKAFFFIGISSALEIIIQGSSAVTIPVVLHIVANLIGCILLGYWVWQYMQLRIRESIFMGLMGATFILATIVTLAFSTILISRVSNETARSLINNARMLDFVLESLKNEALANTLLASNETGLSQAVERNDFSVLNQIAEKILEERNLGFFTITDMTGDVLVRAHALSRRGDSLAEERSFDEASRGVSFITIENSPVEGLSVRSSVPLMKGNKVIGVLIGGYQLDNAFADKIKRMTGLEMFFYGGDVSVASTAFSSDGTTRLVGNTISDPRIRNLIFDEGKNIVGEIPVYGELFQASYTPLINGDGKIIGALSVAKKQSDVAVIVNSTNRLTLVTVILIILILSFPIYYVTKRFETER